MKDEQLAAIRRFNRHFTQRVGALDESFPGRGRPLGEARLLYEIGHGGADLRDLRRRLDLDSGYLSRLLRSLERQGLSVAAAARGDARRRTVSLTSKGRRELAEYDRRSDEYAREILDALSEPQRARLIAAMADVERLIGVSAIRIEPESAASSDASWCLELYYSELGRRFESGYDPTRALSPTAEEMTPPAGMFLIARNMGDPVGCGALKVMPGRVGLIKRMWVHESMRGFRLGARILSRLETEARGLGLRKVQLDTNRTLKEAHALYLRSGYHEVAPFSEEPYAHHWFEKRLTKRPPGPPQRQRRAQPGRR
jgi:DNA-binding MarR family transcriptional regulator/N-acetylglutamate synthase-like GNAT family acetyltransferase